MPGTERLASSVDCTSSLRETSFCVRVVVTGGAGFIGANLTGVLLGDDRFGSVVVIDDLSTGLATNLPDAHPKLRTVVGSILDPNVLAEIGSCDAVVHLAARPSVPRSVIDPVGSHTVNVDGTLGILEAVRQCSVKPHVIFASSSSVYGANAEPIKSEGGLTAPLSPYAVSKLTGEAYVLAYQATYGIPSTAFRFFNVYGALQRADGAYAAVVPRFIAAALEGRPFPIDGDGLQRRDFTHIGTLAEVIASAIADRITSELFSNSPEKSPRP
jgi:UDP-glucose 4-epimerase